MELGPGLQLRADAQPAPFPLAGERVTHIPIISGSPPDSHLTFVELFQQIINSLHEQIALVDDQWTILAVNSEWITTASDQ